MTASQSAAASGVGGVDRAPPTPERDARNRLLLTLPDEDYALLQPHLERVEIGLLEVLAEANEPFTHVYFPESGVISEVSRLADGSVVEVGTIGNEGMSGLSAAMGADPPPTATTMQIPGIVLRVGASLFARLMDERPALRRLVHRYAQAYLVQVGQGAACNRAHEIGERCARWLLMSHDRMAGADQFLLTQEVLAQMLGVRRAGVTVAAGILQKAGLIRYTRGKITVLDRVGLEEAACECYGIVRAQLDQLTGGGSLGAPTVTSGPTAGIPIVGTSL